MHVLPAIAKCVTSIVTFDLWMSKIGFDTFVLMINFIDDDWVPYLVIIKLFEAQNTSRATLVK
jgi:hypothetical protein